MQFWALTCDSDREAYGYEGLLKSPRISRMGQC